MVSTVSTAQRSGVQTNFDSNLFHQRWDGCDASCCSPSYDHPYCASEDQDQVIMSSHDSQSPPTWPPTNHVWPPTKLIQVHSLTYNILNMMLNTMYCCVHVCMYVCMTGLVGIKTNFAQVRSTMPGRTKCATTPMVVPVHPHTERQQPLCCIAPVT